MLTQQDAGRAYFDPTTRGWELAAGAVLATVAAQLETIPAVAGRTLRWIGLGAVGYSVVTFTEGTAFPGWHAGIPVLGACLVIAGGVVSRSRLLEAEPMTMVGEYSYGWYLWHWPALIIAPYLLGHDLTLGEGLGVAGATLLLARITFALVEQPARHSTLRTKPVLAVLLGLALVGASIGTARTVLDLPSRESGAAAAAPVADLTTESKPDRRLAAALEKAVGVQRVPRNLTPKVTMARFDAPRVYRDGCHLEAKPISWSRSCERYGRASAHARRTVVLFGDSHAAQWFPALERIALQRGWRLVNLTKGACTAADVEIYFDFFKRGYTECVEWRQRALDRIDELRPALVVTSSNYDGGTALNPDGTEIAPDKQNDAWIAGWHKTLARLISDSRRTVFIEDTPWQHDNVPDCLAENLKDVPACVTTRDRATTGERRTLLREAARQDGAEVVDPASWFCTETECPVIYGNILMYQDASHVTPEYGRILAPVVRARLKM
ncbi:acyltransferase family protein [Spongisporangium articulatum]|uniref:Acyltransferase family protein n=1 Tax=Spongisporangium articulatum TaxID=3362603 RepID=A0ABW8AGI7_9ACTN